jgi:hypothetical protein
MRQLVNVNPDEMEMTANPYKSKAQRRSSNVTARFGKYLGKYSWQADERCQTYLIHILAKQETPMNARRTVLGRVPARLNTRVIKSRSMFVLLNAEEMVNPPMSSMIVGENMIENTYLQSVSMVGTSNSFNASLCGLPSRQARLPIL